MDRKQIPYLLLSLWHKKFQSDFTKSISQWTLHQSVTSMILEAARLQGTGGTRIRLHILHWWALRHVRGRGLFRVLEAATAIMVAVHGGIHGCSIAARQSAVILWEWNLMSIESEEELKKCTLFQQARLQNGVGIITVILWTWSLAVLTCATAGFQTHSNFSVRFQS